MSSTPRGRPRKLHAVPSLDLSRVPPDSASPVAAAGASKTNAQNAKGKQGGPLGPSADNGRFETPRGRAVPSAAAAPSGSADTKSNLLIVGAILVALAAVWYTQQTPATGPTSQVSDATTSPPKAEPSPSTASASQQGPSATASKPPAPAPSTPPSTAPANAASAPKTPPSAVETPPPKPKETPLSDKDFLQTADKPNAPPAVFKGVIIAEYKHDKTAFTQGLVIHNGVMYEGTGLKGQSTLRKVHLSTGRLQDISYLDSRYFGEGITVFNDTIVQLTWQEHEGFVYKLDFSRMLNFRYDFEGWGITQDGKDLIISDGSDQLIFMNPTNYKVHRKLPVKAWTQASAGAELKAEPVTRLNELEYINGLVFANVWYTHRIAAISPETGFVQYWIDLSDIYPPDQHPAKLNRDAVLNGIAFDNSSQHMFVTGKLWPKLLQIKYPPYAKSS